MSEMEAPVFTRHLSVIAICSFSAVPLAVVCPSCSLKHDGTRPTHTYR